jgi:transcriptional regulator with XRE-family HTH domain
MKSLDTRKKLVFRASAGQEGTCAAHRLTNTFVGVAEGDLQPHPNLGNRQSFEVSEPEHYAISLRQARENVSREKLSLCVSRIKVRAGVEYVADGRGPLTVTPVVAASVADGRYEPFFWFPNMRARADQRDKHIVDEGVGVARRHSELAAGEEEQKSIVRVIEDLDGRLGRRRLAVAWWRARLSVYRVIRGRAPVLDGEFLNRFTGSRTVPHRVPPYRCRTLYHPPHDIVVTARGATVSVPPPDEALRTLASVIRSTRLGRGVKLAQMARDLGVSRTQLQALENGRNVSVKFLLHVARYLELTTLPLDGHVQLVASGHSGNFNLVDVIQTLDLLTALVDHLRDVAVTASLPSSARSDLQDTPALKKFVEQVMADEDMTGAQRLAQALTRIPDDLKASGQRSRNSVSATPARTKKRVG